MHPKITILGCGLSGMLTALAFASHNIPTIIIERRSTSHKDFFKDIRTTALTSASKELFEKIGIWDDLVKHTGAFNDIYVADNRSEEMLHFASSELEDGQKMGHLIQNEDFKRSLFELTEAHKLITIKEDTSYKITENTPRSCKLLLNDKTKHECEMLIVCDGRMSEARQKYFSPEVEKSYKQHAITFIVHHEKPHEGTAVEHFMCSGPFAMLPLKDQNLSSVVWTIDSDKVDAFMNLPKDEFLYVVQKNFGEFLGEIKIQGETAAFPLKAYSTSQYYNKSIILIADTAHIVHPLAGQGLNQGIKDIESIIGFVLEYGATEHAFKAYQDSRKTDNNNMLEVTDVINAVFSNDSKLFRAVRQVGFKVIETVPPFKKLLIKYAMGKR